jgi:hypothetical protein
MFYNRTKVPAKFMGGSFAGKCWAGNGFQSDLRPSQFKNALLFAFGRSRLKYWI